MATFAPLAYVRCVAGGCFLVVLATATPAFGQTSVTTSPTAAQQQAEDKDLINPDRPGIADGSTVIGRGRFQLEAGFQQESRQVDEGTEHTRFVPTLFRIGLSSRWEARFESNTLTQTDSPSQARVANPSAMFAPVSFGGKFHIQDSDGVRQPSLGTILRIFPASGTDDLHTTHVTGDLRLAADWDVTSRISLNPNVGVAFYEDDSKRRFTAGLFAVTLSYFNEAKTVSPFVDVGVQAPETSAAGSSIILDGGVAYLPGRNLQIDVSAGTGPRGGTPPHLFFSVGMSVR